MFIPYFGINGPKARLRERQDVCSNKYRSSVIPEKKQETRKGSAEKRDYMNCYAANLLRTNPAREPTEPSKTSDAGSGITTVVSLANVSL